MEIITVREILKKIKSHCNYHYVTLVNCRGEKIVELYLDMYRFNSKNILPSKIEEYANCEIEDFLVFINFPGENSMVNITIYLP